MFAFRQLIFAGLILQSDQRLPHQMCASFLFRDALWRSRNRSGAHRCLKRIESRRLKAYPPTSNLITVKKIGNDVISETESPCKLPSTSRIFPPEFTANQYRLPAQRVTKVNGWASVPPRPLRAAIAPDLPLPSWSLVLSPRSAWYQLMTNDTNEY